MTESACEPDGAGAGGHVFLVPAEGETLREQPCLCGAVTWGELDDLRLLTRMWAS